MLSQTTLTCPSDFFTVFTNVLRYTVIRLSLIFQGIEVCRYGFYGVKGYTPYIYSYKKINLLKRARARKGIYCTVKSVKSVKRILQTV